MAKNNEGTGKDSIDKRFARIESDPKFRAPKQKNLKIKLDDRFSKQDLEYKRKAKVDKYGRRIGTAPGKEEKDFEKYFTKESSESAAEESDKEDSSVAKLDRARGEVPADYVSSSDEESSSESEADSDDATAESDEEVEIEEEKPESGDPSKVLAVVNLDWDHVKCADLLVAFNSFVPEGGKIERVAIYPSEFGKERMQREEVEGPPREVFKSKKDKKAKQDDDDEIGLKDLYEQGDAEKDYDSKALRRYQLERLRYYYAVVYCNNVATAEAIYQNCDGTEYESTANMFDLRYVPEGVTFDDEPREECASVPKDYKPVQFSTSALQHSQVKLTWDETPADRVEMAKRAFSQKEIEDMDFKAYLASDSEESEADDNSEAKNKLRSLVSSVKVADKPLFADESDEEEADVQITFTPGLEGGEAKEEDAEEENILEKLKRKEKERRKKRKERVKELKKQAEEEKKSSKKEKHASKSESEQKSENDKRAELELLMMEDDENSQSINSSAHFNMNDILRSEKERGKKSKYQKKDKIVEDDFKPDLNDPRFKEVFEDRDFAIDPSQPEFKETAAMKQILQERRKRSSKSASKKRKTDEQSDSAMDSAGDLKGLVAKLKRKGKKPKL
ncbi:AER259Wp [Eremothecium gossypii ATCC 10895]|uniref:Pre-rRNA-processing protein ESF1 n=1 Tax=Eremothecium gossypii (strain ATCC 10895 / CBS 109.51 / FGSC 9923 / NRRL Y-1056) TaxID=284811 RepID=ESF1_EREGS|nr:AER259Wp [Eremothecium gossypii ATCC 10895]Q756J5.2 RecName: Full=Pre-rRNA-processing protein ESF1; AltName: Full=18S rRNA factor 1 [Eremothecium gossypii ATCC 10895]AAS52940.2 AER259Wp [Eremothecium gossypii ATCC 10895]AEY97248.1 FAER259Wp [Eremothecium gossypii FDAG1]